MEDWVPLELCFGVPLFSEQANRDVCDKVGSEGERVLVVLVTV